MPLDVIMPALGMAQESGVIVAWHKKPGDAVAEGDVLFEVETDKATMEVEAQGEGFLAGVSAKEGDEVAVGNVIARIADSAEDAANDGGADSTGGAPAGAAKATGGETAALPEGAEIIMPTLGMAQDTGLLVDWLVELGAKVGADDLLFEVETDKTTMEVPAGADGYLAAQLAKPGEEVPTGDVVAIITAEAPAETVSRSRNEAAAPAPEAPAKKDAAEKPRPQKSGKSPSPSPQSASSNGRILASPKARRLALEKGLDLSRLVQEGVPQPFHAKDIATLAALPAESAGTALSAGQAGMRLTAAIPADGTPDFLAWATKNAGISDPAALLAALAAASLGHETPVIAVEAFSKRHLFRVTGRSLAAVEAIEDATPALMLRDLRATRITAVSLGPEAVPVLSLTRAAAGFELTLECAPGQLSPEAALDLLNDFAGRVEDPLRHLL